MEVVVKLRTSLRTSSQRLLIARGEVERRLHQIRQAIDLRQKSGCGLYRMLRSRVSAGKACAAEMGHPLETLAHAAGKELAAPDAAVVAVTGAIEAHAKHAPVPLAVLCQHRGDVGAMMLHRALLGRREDSRA